MRYYFHIRIQDTYDEDLDGVDLDSPNGEAEAVVIARRMVSELLLDGDAIDNMVFEIRDENGNIVAELPFSSCSQLQ